MHLLKADTFRPKARAMDKAEITPESHWNSHLLSWKLFILIQYTRRAVTMEATGAVPPSQNIFAPPSMYECILNEYENQISNLNLI